MAKGLLEKIVKKEERSDGGFLYTYELIMREGMRVADWKLPLYSVKVSMTDPEGQKSQREATDVFKNRERAVDFFDRLVRNLATPIDLGYVVEDEVIN